MKNTLTFWILLYFVNWFLGTFSTWSSFSLWISLKGSDVFSKSSFVFSDFLTLFIRLDCKLCCVWQSPLSYFPQTGVFPVLIKTFLFLKIYLWKYRSLNSLQSLYSIGLWQSGLDHVYIPAVYNLRET